MPKFLFPFDFLAWFPQWFYNLRQFFAIKAGSYAHMSFSNRLLGSFHTGFEICGTFFCYSDGGLCTDILFHSISRHAFHTSFEISCSFFVIRRELMAKFLFPFDFQAGFEIRSTSHWRGDSLCPYLCFHSTSWHSFHTGI